MAALTSLRPCPQCGTACEPDHQYCPGCGFPVGAVATGSEDKLVGKTLPGGYQILDLLSVGGMGRVYRAEQRALGRTVAVKVIHPHLLCDENSIMRFMTEARAASQLNHPNSVSVIDFGKTEDGQPYLVMEFLRGKDLARVAYEQGPLPFKRIVDVLRQVLLALSEAHDLEIVHRDLKPENIILEPLRRGGDFVKVVDFGLAKLRADASTPNVTMPGIVCGTPDYMAPEQGRGDPIDGRSDLYAVGVILFQLLTGRLPFESENPTQVVMMHLTVPIPDPAEVAPDRNIPEALVRVVHRALAKNANDRYQEALEFADALQEAIAETRSSAPDALSTIKPGQSVECPECNSMVPVARFCCDCGARLPVKTERPSQGMGVFDDSPALPLGLYARDSDLSWLTEQRRKGRQGLAAIRLVGEPGMGKTRLLEEFLKQAREDGDFTIEVGPDPYGAEVAFYTLRQVIYALLGVKSSSGSRRSFREAREDEQRGLEEVLGELPEGAARGTPAERRADVSAALGWALCRAATRPRKRRVIVAIEDLERIDGVSRNAFKDLFGRLDTQLPVLLVATHAPRFEPGWDQSAARTLLGLPAAEANRLIRTRHPGERLSAEHAARGVAPLYAEQVLRFLTEGGSEPPASLADLITHRLGTLDPAARQVLQALAVLGDRVEPPSLRALLGEDINIEASLRQVIDKDMVARDGDVVSLRHPLFREIILLATPAGVRRELHRRTIRLYDRQGAPIEARALHAYHAQESFEALLLIEQIAERALARGDEEGAVIALRRGLDLSREELYRGELDDPMRAVSIFGRKLGDALTQAGNFGDAYGVLREALDMTGPMGVERAQLLASLARVAYERERRDEAVGFIDEAIDIARRSSAQGLAEDLSQVRSRWA